MMVSFLKTWTSLIWAIVGALIYGIGWLAFVQGTLVLHTGNVTDPGNMLNSAPIFGAVAFAFLFSFRCAQVSAEEKGTKIVLWRQVSLLILGCGVLALAIIRAYRAIAIEGDIASTMILAIAWALIGALIGWLIGDKKRFQGLLRK